MVDFGASWASGAMTEGETPKIFSCKDLNLPPPEAYPGTPVGWVPGTASCPNSGGPVFGSRQKDLHSGEDLEASGVSTPPQPTQAPTDRKGSHER